MSSLTEWIISNPCRHGPFSLVYLNKCSSAWPKGKQALLEARGAWRQLAVKLSFKISTSSNRALVLRWVHVSYLEVWPNHFRAVQADNMLWKQTKAHAASPRIPLRECTGGCWGGDSQVGVGLAKLLLKIQTELKWTSRMSLKFLA